MKRFRDLDPEDFRGATVFVDVDGTLVSDGEGALAPAEAETLARLTQSADVYLIASKGYHRLVPMAESHGARAIVTDAIKPSKKIIAGVPHLHYARYVIGDKIMTDGWFAARIGARFVPVDRLISGTETPFVLTLYAADALVFAMVSVWHAIERSTPWQYLTLARPPQWWKNLLMLVPAVLAGTLFDVHAMVLLYAFIAFSSAAAASYVMNDIIDVQRDRANPKKRHRPIASGAIPIPYALLFAALLAGVAIAAASEVPAIIPWVLAYLLLTHIYTFYLKRFPVVELFAVSGFYLLRVLAGAGATGIAAPPSVLLVTFFGSLLVASGNRYAQSRRGYREFVSREYPADFLKSMPIFCGVLTTLTYALIALATGPGYFWTTPLALFVILWYLRSTYRTWSGIAPEERFWDGMVLWSAVAFILGILALLPYG